MSDDQGHYEGQDLEALADLPRYYGWIADAFGEGLRGRVLEVGAGVGNFTARYLPRVREAVLVEPARNLAPRLAARFAGDARVRVVGDTLEGARAAGALGAEPFDAAVMVNVLEHVRDHGGLLRSLREALRPGGALLLFVPAVPWLYGSLDAVVGHERRYTRGALEGVVEGAGFEVLSSRYFDLPGVLPWLVAGRVLGARRFDGRAAGLYDRLVPVIAAAERRWRPPLGKNLVCVARREGAAGGGGL